jgi:hypothetical protein
MPPLAGSQYLVAETVRRLKDEPLRLFTQYPVKIFWLLQPFDWETLSWPVLGTRSFNVTYFVISMLALFGVREALRRDRTLTLLLLLPLGYLALLSFPFYGSPRFRVPAEPFLTPLAALGAITVIKGLRRRLPAAHTDPGPETA